MRISLPTALALCALVTACADEPAPKPPAPLPQPSTGTCGDGLLHELERCDDGNVAGGDYCSADCKTVTGRCGDGVLQTNEVCDDGNIAPGDSCAADCSALSLAPCGDGQVQETERCDDGNTESGDYCSADCRAVTGLCGDGLIQSNEQCDDGDTRDAGNGCSSTCQRNDRCGNGAVEALYEDCDDGNTSDGDYCAASCQGTSGRCGDGVVQPNETCDDGNNRNADYCSSDCQDSAGACGDGEKQPFEACDDENTDGGDYCAADCSRLTGSCGDNQLQPRREACDDGEPGDNTDDDYCQDYCEVSGRCGDGEVQTAMEACDDGNTASGDYCTGNCQAVTGRCGDSLTEPNEVCDDGNGDQEDYCSCQLKGVCGDAIVQHTLEDCDDGDTVDTFNGCDPFCRANNDCGDGVKEAAVEGCDDANSADGDGCDSNCQPTGCGNGRVTAGEVCDDGNAVDGDGCDSLCRIEIEYVDGYQFADYDVAGDGSLFHLSWRYSYDNDSGNESVALVGRCYAPDGSVRRADFVIDSGANYEALEVNFFTGQVVTARDSGISVVSWLRREVEGRYDTKKPRSRFFDAACQPIGSTILWPAPPSYSYVVDSAVDAAGNFAALWDDPYQGGRPEVTFYSPTGTFLSQLRVDDTYKCLGFTGMHVALHPTSGVGIVTCQREESPIYFRRFTFDDAWLDGAMVLLAGSANNNSSSRSTHIVALGDDGFAVEWQNQRLRRFEAAFFEPDGDAVTQVAVGSTGSGTSNAFEHAHQTIAFQGANYVLHDHRQPATFWLYSPVGQLLGCDQALVEARSLRSPRGEAAWFLGVDPYAFVRDVLDFERWQGCARPTCGDGDLDVGEQCDDGNLTPHDGCDANCHAEVCGDGVVLAAEQCDDGNTSAGDGCAACLIEPSLPKEWVAIEDASIYDYDVDQDGRVVVVDYEDSTVRAACFHPDGTLQRALFPVTLPGESHSPDVHVAKESGRAVIILQHAITGRKQAVLLDEDCFIDRRPFDLLPPNRYFEDAAVDGDGNLVVAARYSDTGYLLFFDRNGMPVGPELEPDDNGLCQDGIRVAMGPAGDGGVVACSQNRNDPLTFRRFSLADGFTDPALLDPQMRAVPSTEMGSGLDSERDFVVGMDDTGSFAIAWLRQDHHEAAFFGAGGDLVRHVVLGRRLNGDGQGLGQRHEPVGLLRAGFVLRNTDRPTTYWLYSPAGVSLGCDQTVHVIDSGGHLRNLYRPRTSLAGVFLQDYRTIYPDALDFGRWLGCGRPTCGDRTVDFGEECDDGNDVPYDGCDPFCGLERCGDGVVTGVEACDDGNAYGGDGCDSACRLERHDPFPSPIVYGEDDDFNVADYDTASDGSLVVLLEGDNGSLFAACYLPDKTLRRAPFPITLPGTPTNDGMVTVSRLSKKALVSWEDDNDNTIYAALLDKNCYVARREFQVLPHSASEHEAAIDDRGASVVAAVVQLPDADYQDVRVAFLDPQGRPLGGETVLALPEENVYDVHVAMNQASGAGVVGLQAQYGEVLYYRRFGSDRGFVEPGLVHVEDAMVASYYSHTVGMNDRGEFVLEWRNPSGAVLAAFYDDGGTQRSTETLSTRTRDEEGDYYASFSRMHQEIQLQGPNFVLGEAFQSIYVEPLGQRYFVYSPLGAELSSFETLHGAPGGLHARLDGRGSSYFRRHSEIFFGPEQL